MIEVKINGVIVPLVPSVALRSTGYFILAVRYGNGPAELPQETDFRSAVKDARGTILERIPVEGNPEGVRVYLYHVPSGNQLFNNAAEFSIERKFNPMLIDLNPGARGLRDEAPQSQEAWLTAVQRVESQPLRIDLHGSVEVEDVLGRILAAARVDVRAATVFPRLRYTVPPNIERVKPGAVILTAPGSVIPAIADIPGVRLVSPIPRFEPTNNKARLVLGLKPGSKTTNPAEDILAGEGEVVVVADTGFDRGKTTSDLLAEAFDSSGSQPPRVIAVLPLGDRDIGDDPHGHGTHVAGSVLGCDTFNRAEPDYFKQGVYGVAYRARLVVQALFRDHYEPVWGARFRRVAPGPEGVVSVSLYDHLFKPAYYDYHARIHTNSWGAPKGSGSNDPDPEDVNQAVNIHRDLVILFAAGNEGKPTAAFDDIAPDSIVLPATAKNCITVGASENDRPNDGPTRLWRDILVDDKWKTETQTLPTMGNPVAGDPNSMAPFSSRGPVSGGRIKPDLVAPGTSILSTRSLISTNKGWGLADERSEEIYLYMGGTSMATPLVAGCAAIVRAYLLKEKNWPSSPSAALVKAALINGAQPIWGHYTGTGIPNNHQGFGRVNVAASLGLDGSKVEFIDESVDRMLSPIPVDGITVASSYVHKVTISPGQTLKVTLVWTDPEFGDDLINDLDLIVRCNGQKRHGNMAPTEQVAFDTVNNVEQVTWLFVPGSEVLIEVNGAKVAEPQTYALVYSIMTPSEWRSGRRTGERA